ncbi:MAG: hypothetical protein AB7O52_15435 [Planctomycetota bacterium]
MPEVAYRVLHLVGIALTLMAIGGVVVSHLGGTPTPKGRKFAAIMHGVGLLIVLVAGFGLLAKMKLGFPIYILLKLVIWMALGAITSAILRAPRLAIACWWATAALVTAAGVLVWTKPFE